MSKANTNILFGGEKVTISGPALKEGAKMPEFVLSDVGLGDIQSKDFTGKALAILTLPSLDTPVSSGAACRFDHAFSEYGPETLLISVSMDLPFALKRWASTASCQRIITASDYKRRGFAEAFGVLIEECTLLMPAVFVVNKEGTIVHLEYVTEVLEEPDYSAALAKVSLVAD